MATLAALLVAFSFQGSRGLWEPDEGRYVDAAVAMLEAGDWLVPKLHGRPYLDKPPLHYWSIAAGLRMWGFSEWGARFFNAVAFVLTGLFVGGLAQRFWGGWAGPLAQLLYAATLLPAIAAFTLTPDTLLSLFSTGSLFLYWMLMRDRGAHNWALGAGLGLLIGLGAAVKGPAMLVFTAPLVIHALIRLGPRQLFRRSDLWWCCAVSSLVGLSWYVAVVGRLPGALDYLVDNQIAGRLWHSGYGRNPGAWRGLTLYLPLLVVGLLPTSFFWVRAVPEACLRLACAWRGGRISAWLGGKRGLLLIAVVLPVVVFTFSSSKLPLYVLPLAAPLVVATSARWTLGGRRVLVLGAASVLLLVAVKGAASSVSTERDTRALAALLTRAGVDRETQVVVVGAKRHALPFYGYENLQWVLTSEYPYFSPPPLFEDFLENLARDRRRNRIIVSDHDLGQVLEEWGLNCRSLPEAHHPRIYLARCG